MMLRIVQVKSGAGRKKNQRETLRCLGLRGPGSFVVRQDDPVTIGMVNCVHHLVTTSHTEEASS